MAQKWSVKQVVLKIKLLSNLQTWLQAFNKKKTAIEWFESIINY